MIISDFFLDLRGAGREKQFIEPAENASTTVFLADLSSSFPRCSSQVVAVSHTITPIKIMYTVVTLLRLDRCYTSALYLPKK